MGSGIFFPLSALPIIILIITIFNIKKHVKNPETKIYNYLIVINFIGLLIELLCALACKYYQVYPIISYFVLKTYLVYLIGWTATFTIYVLRITITNWKKVYTRIHWFVILTLFLIIYILPINVVVDNNYEIFYTRGMGVNFSYIVSGIYIFTMFVALFKNTKKIEDKKYFPVFLFIIIGTIAIVIQEVYPQYLLLTYTETFICLVMYFTIENPDLKMLEEIENARLHAEKANRAKSDFLSSMSHEIRTPLNAIVGLSEDIRDYIDGDDKQRIKEDSELLLSSSEILLEIVGNIIDISKIESQKLDIIDKVYKPRDEIEKLTKVTATRIGSKPLKFNLTIAEDLPYELIGDYGKVKQVINNLLTNAIKYTDEGEINLRIDCINQKNVSVLNISCKDTGRGITAENMKKLFTKFERLDVEKNSTIEGTGLGLAITKNLVEMMGGKISVSSRFGEGSLFIAQIPQKIKTLMKPRDAEEELVVNNSNVNVKKVNKVLIVDDNNINIIVARKVLNEIVENIESVTSGQACLDKINEKNEYDVILMDIMMPGMGGETTLKKLKEIEGFNTPVIAVTADAESTSKTKYLSEGFSDYVAKPFRKEEIKSVLDKYSSNRNIN